MGSGARYIDWTHIKVIGSVAAAAPWVAEGRKMLGYVWDEAERTGLGVHQLVRTMKDGTVIIAEKHGSIPRITIAPTEGGGDERRNKIRGFVCKPTSTDLPNSWNEDHPEAAIVSSGDTEWATLYFDRRDPPWEDVPAPKSTYPRIAGLAAFPEGLNKYGNVDWLGDKEERVSWMGSELRYFNVENQPRGPCVYRAGKVLFDLADTEDYGSWHVRGACIRGMNLLVVIASESANDTNGSATYRLLRVGLQTAPPENGLANLIALTDDVESLWTDSYGKSAESYFFNQSGTVACWCGGSAADFKDYQLVTLEIEEEDGVLTATGSMQAAPGKVTSNTGATEYGVLGGSTIVRTGVVESTEFTPAISPASGTRQWLSGDVSADRLVARDFKGDEPVDITLNVSGSVEQVQAATFSTTFVRMYSPTEGFSLGNGSGSVDEARYEKHATLKMGGISIELWNISHSTYGGSILFGGQDGVEDAYTDEELEVIARAHYLEALDIMPESTITTRMKIICGIDARFDTLVYYDLRYSGSGGKPQPDIVHPGQTARWLEANLVWQSGDTKTTMIPYAKSLAPLENWLRTEADFSYQASGLNHVQAHRFPLEFNPAGDGSINVRHLKKYVPDVPGWLNRVFVDWSPGIAKNSDNSEAITTLAVLTAEEAFYAGLDPAVLGASVAWSNRFDPWERTSIIGDGRRLHPVWVLPTTSLEIKTEAGQ